MFFALSDINMPGMCGLDLLKILKDKYPRLTGPETPENGNSVQHRDGVADYFAPTRVELHSPQTAGLVGIEHMSRLDVHGVDSAGDQIDHRIRSQVQ